jgi:D-3-phosphoglycerate dehydrogenase / 2-oxoglutarate reductase
MPYNSPKKNICLIIDPVHEALFPYLEKAGLQYIYLPKITREEFEAYLPTITGVVVRSRYALTEAYLKMAPHLQFIARAGAGVDQIDLAQAKKQNIVILNAPEGNRDALAEHTIGMLLALINNMHMADREIRMGQWNREENRGQELSEMTVGIVGYGYMGQATAKRLAVFGCRILVYDKYHRNFDHNYVEEVDWQTIQKEANVLSLHIPLTQESRFWISSAEIDKFTNPFYLVNTARGEVISLESLKHGIASGKIIGAALDVLENEKLQSLSSDQKKHFDWLISQKNILFTPHVGGWTHASFRKISETLGNKILSHIHGEK